MLSVVGYDWTVKVKNSMWVRKNTERTTPVWVRYTQFRYAQQYKYLKYAQSEYWVSLGYSLWVHFEYLYCCAYWNWVCHTQYRHRALSILRLQTLLSVTPSSVFVVPVKWLVIIGHVNRSFYLLTIGPTYKLSVAKYHATSAYPQPYLTLILNLV